MNKNDDHWGKAIISNNGNRIGMINSSDPRDGDTSHSSLFPSVSSFAFSSGPMAKGESAFLNEVEEQIKALNLKVSHIGV